MKKKRKKDPFIYRHESYSGTRHKNDIAWWEVQIPSRWHLCKVQTTGWLNGGWARLDFCRCGATRKWGYLGRWKMRNSRRRWNAK